ncbi:MAG: DUF4124 domain-containing protein [Nitrososphaera sp.]
MSGCAGAIFRQQIWLFALPSQGLIYSWRNAQGVIQYSDSCPQSVRLKKRSL